MLIIKCPHPPTPYPSPHHHLKKIKKGAILFFWCSFFVLLNASLQTEKSLCNPLLVTWCCFSARGESACVGYADSWRLSAGTGKLCIFGHLGLVFIWSCFVSCLLLLLYYVICAPVLTEGTDSCFDLTDTWFFCISFKTIETSILNVNTANIKHVLIRAPG